MYASDRLPPAPLAAPIAKCRHLASLTILAASDEDEDPPRDRRPQFYLLFPFSTSSPGRASWRVALFARVVLKYYYWKNNFSCQST